MKEKELLMIAADAIQSWPKRRKKALEVYHSVDEFECRNTWALPANGGWPALEMFSAGCTNEEKEQVDKCLRLYWETEVNSSDVRAVLGCMPLFFNIQIQDNFRKLEEIIPDYTRHIDNQWHASRYANRLRRIAEGDGPKEIQKESPEQWFARRMSLIKK